MFKNYRRTDITQAALFEKGMEDGYITRYYNDEDVNANGSISTSSIYGEHEIQIAYVLDSDGCKILSCGFGREYLCITNGIKSLICKEEFESKYESI